MIIEQRPALFLNHTHNQHNSSPSFLFCLPSVTLFLFFFHVHFSFFGERERENHWPPGTTVAFFEKCFGQEQKKNPSQWNKQKIFEKRNCVKFQQQQQQQQEWREREREMRNGWFRFGQQCGQFKKEWNVWKNQKEKKERNNGRNCDSLWMCVQIRQAKRTHLDGFFFLFPTLFSPLAIFFFFCLRVFQLRTFFLLKFQDQL